MTIIPFAEALKLLDRAFNISVPGYSETKSFILNTDEGAYAFLELDLEEGDHEFFFRFLESANQTVKLEGDVMTLVYDDAVVDDIPPEIEIKLMAPMVLEPSMGEVHAQQCKLESSLNRILEYCRDGYHPGEVRLHAQAAKEAFDWLDNFTVLRASQPEVAAEAGPLQENDQQDDRKDGADDLQGQRGEEPTEQPVDDGKDKGEDQDGQECGEQHPAPYQAEEPPATDPFAMPPLVLQALRHVRAHIPDVDRVVFWGEGVWVFLTDCLTVPSFDGVLIDTSLLEEAADSVADGYPRAFQLPPTEK